jgi:hypothetical protein
MRIVFVVFATLMTLGLLAFGVVIRPRPFHRQQYRAAPFAAVISATSSSETFITRCREHGEL